MVTFFLIGPNIPLSILFTDSFSLSFFFLYGAAAPNRPGPPHYQGFTITLRHNPQYDSYGPTISPMQRPLPDNTQYSQQTSMPLAGFKPTITPSRQPQTCLRPHSHRDLLPSLLQTNFCSHKTRGQIIILFL